jgi:5-methylthioadenosine/S-adenosylhomocysteine deaminase
MPPEPVDLLIEARWVLPIAPVNTVLADHAVAVVSGKIVALGPIAQMNERFEPRDRVVRRDHALLPGFVNAHTRAAMTMLRGLPVRGPRSQWVRDTVRPAEQRCMSAEFVREGTQFAIAEMLRAGITSFADMYWFPEESARAASAARMRAAIGLPVADAPNIWADSATAHFEKAEQLWDEYKSDPWVCLYFAPQDANEVSDQTLIRVRRVADELDARIAMESPPLQRLHTLGLLRPGFAAIPQDVWTDAESELVATTGICVIACVQSDLRLGGGALSSGGGRSGDLLSDGGRSGGALSSVSKLVGQTVGLGSGDPASVGAIDLLAEARVAALLDSELTAEGALRLATLGGATALGFGSVAGSIEPGKYADLVCVDLNRLASQPTTNVPGSIVFGATREQVSDVWTSGRLAVSGGHLLAFDEQELTSFAEKWLRIEGGGT